MAKQLNRHGRAPRKGDGIAVRNSQVRRLREALGDDRISSLPEASGVRQATEALLRATITQLDNGDPIDKSLLHDTVWRGLDVTDDDWDKGLELAKRLGRDLI